MATKSHSLEEHVQMGQLIKNVYKAIDEVIEFGRQHDMMNSKHYERLYKMRGSRALYGLQSNLDDEMFRDCPYLTNDAFGVYYHEDETVTAEYLRDCVDKARKPI